MRRYIVAGSLAAKAEAACREAGVVLAIGYQRRRESQFRWIRERIDAGALGKLVNAEANISRDRLGRIDLGSWRYTAEGMPGGVMLQIGIHYTDVLEYLIGPVKAVSAMLAQLVLPGENPDVASLVLEHENGALSTHVKAGTVRLLAALIPQRDPALPEVPTALEQGVNVLVEAWRGIAVPHGTPAPTVAALEPAICKTVDAPEFERACEQLGIRPAYLPAAEFGPLIAKEDAEFAALMQQIGLKTLMFVVSTLLASCLRLGQYHLSITTHRPQDLVSHVVSPTILKQSNVPAFTVSFS